MSQEQPNQPVEVNRCPACNSGAVSVFQTLSLPAILFPIEKEKRNEVPMRQLRAMFCDDCGHVYQSEIDPLFSEKIYTDYYYLYPFDQLESMQLAYRSPFEEVARLYLNGGQEKTLLEIGCGSPQQMEFFLNLNCCCTAINPGAQPHPRVEFIDGFYGQVKLARTFDVIVSRFNLEHILDCDTFFSCLHENTHENSLVMVQVPNAEYFLENGVLNVLAHEHPHCFCRRSLIALVERSGFQIVHLSKADEPSVICLFSPAHDKNTYHPAEHRARHRVMETEVKKLIRSAPERVVLYGASLSLTSILYGGGLEPDLLEKILVVDDNPMLWGRFMPNTPVEIVSPDRMDTVPDAIIILLLSHHYHAGLIPRLRKRNPGNQIYAVSGNGVILVQETSGQELSQ